MKSIIFTFTFISFYLLSSGQNIKEDLVKISKANKQLDNYKSSLSFKVYLDNTLYQSETGTVKVSGEKYHLKLNKMEVFNNGAINILVDHGGKLIFTSKAEKMDGKFTTSLEWDSLLNKTSKHEFTMINPTNYKYTFFYETGVNESLEIHFNPKNYRVFKIKTTTRKLVEAKQGKPEKMSSIIEINNFESISSFTSKDFSGGSYVQIEGSSVKLKEKVRDYRLFNGLQENNN